MVGRARDGRTWRVGTDAEIAWIVNGTSIGRTITAAIPPVFQAYATLVLPERGDGQDRHDRVVLALLSEQSAGQQWWLGISTPAQVTSCFPVRRWGRCISGGITCWSRQDRSRPAVGVFTAPGRSARAHCLISCFPPITPGWYQRCGMTTGPASAGQPSWWAGSCATAALEELLSLLEIN